MGMIHVWEGRDCLTGDTLSPLPRPRSLSHGGFLPFHSPPPSCRPPATLGYLRGEKKLLKEGQWGWPSREALATRRAGELCFGLLRNMPSHPAQQARSRPISAASVPLSSPLLRRAQAGMPGAGWKPCSAPSRPSRWAPCTRRLAHAPACPQPGGRWGTPPAPL